LKLDTEDIWGPLGEKWWTENGDACRATPQQVRYSAARHGGATRSKSAELAGYAGDAQALRSAGSRVDDTDTVKNLLTLAAAASAGLTNVDPVTVKECKDKVGKLVRSPDSGVALKAAELFVKLEQAEKVRGEHPDDDGLSDWRLCRDYLRMENGATAFITLYKAAWGDMGHVANLPLLRDVHWKMESEPFGKQVWCWSVSCLSDEMKRCLQERLDDPEWQKDTRKQIWGEIGLAPLGAI
jgi:hypothetical protein